MPPNPSSPGGGHARRRRHTTTTPVTDVQSSGGNYGHGRVHKYRKSHPVYSPPPTTDVQSSGGNYGLHKAAKYKKTKAYKRTVRQVYKSQPAAQRRKTARASRKAKHPSVDQRVVTQAHRKWVKREKALQALYKSAGLGFTPHRRRVLGLSAAPVKKIESKSGGLPLGAILAAPAELAVTPLVAAAKVVKKGVEKGPGAALGAALDPGTYHPLIGAAEQLPGKAGRLSRNAARDYVNLPAQSVASTYKLGKDTVTKGPKQGAEDLIGPYKQLLEHPGKSFSEHPLTSALMVAGPLKGADEGIGRAMRLSPSKTLRRAASTKRTVRVPGTAIADEHPYARGPVHKAAQKAGERHKAKKVTKLRGKAGKHEAAGEHDAAVEASAKAGKIENRNVQRVVHRRVDERVDANEGVRRINRARTTHEARKATSKHGEAGQSLAAQGITTTSKEDLRTYRQEVASTVEHLGPARRKQAKQLISQIDKTLKDRKATPEKIQAVAEKFTTLERGLRDEMVKHGLLSKQEADVAPLVPYATRHMDAVHDNGKLIAHGGHELTPAAVRAHMKAHGFKEPAFISQAPNQRNAYFIEPNQAQHLRQITRTGKATREGTFDASRQSMVDQVVRMRGLLDAHKGFQGFLKEFSWRDPENGGRAPQWSFKRAQEKVNELNADPASPGYRVVRTSPFHGREAQVKDLMSGVDSHDTRTTVPEAISAALEGKPEPGGRYTIILDSAARRLGEHQRVGSAQAGKIFGAYTQLWRRSVLATSPKWATGNIVEAAVRNTLMRAGPRSFVTGRKTIKALERTDPQAAQELAVRAVGGGHFQFAERSHVKRLADQFDNQRVERLAQAIQRWGEKPGGKQVAQAWRLWSGLVFHSMGKLESQFQVAMLGKHIRTELMPNNAQKMFGQAIEDAANGLKGTDAQVAAARAVDRAYGKYSKFSPKARRAFALYTPFAAWFLNAVTFVTKVLPQDHPVVTALLASANQATEEWRKQHGLNITILGGGVKDGELPSFLQGMIPVSRGGHQPFPLRYTPFSAYAEFPNNLPGMVLPQLQTGLKALDGMDWKNQQLRNPDGSEFDAGQKVKYAIAQSLLDATPFASRVQSTAKDPGTLNPARPYRSKKDQQAAASAKGALPAPPKLPPLPPLPKLPAPPSP